MGGISIITITSTENLRCMISTFTFTIWEKILCELRALAKNSLLTLFWAKSCWSFWSDQTTPYWYAAWLPLRTVCFENTVQYTPFCFCIPGSIQLFIDHFMSVNGDSYLSSPKKCGTELKICAGCYTLLRLTANLSRAHKVDVPYWKSENVGCTKFFHQTKNVVGCTLPKIWVTCCCALLKNWVGRYKLLRPTENPSRAQQFVAPYKKSE